MRYMTSVRLSVLRLKGWDSFRIHQLHLCVVNGKPLFVVIAFISIAELYTHCTVYREIGKMRRAAPFGSPPHYECYCILTKLERFFSFLLVEGYKLVIAEAFRF